VIILNIFPVPLAAPNPGVAGFWGGERRDHREVSWAMSAGKIAASLGITERAAKARHTRALKRLRSLLGED
jgi:hypothetical protein